MGLSSAGIAIALPLAAASGMAARKARLARECCDISVGAFITRLSRAFRVCSSLQYRRRAHERVFRQRQYIPAEAMQRVARQVCLTASDIALMDRTTAKK
jgi:hypothetical protein